MFAKTLAMAAAAVTVLLGPDVERECPRNLSPGSATGNTVLVTVPAAEGARADMVLFVDAATDDGPPDGTADHVFRLQMDEAEDLRLQLAGVRVDWDPHTVSIRDAPGGPLALTIQQPFGPAPSSTFVGFGLSRTAGREVALPAGEPTAAQYAALVAEAGSAADEQECDDPHGGAEGSSACTVGCNGGCSVSCKAGYAACCRCVLPWPRCLCVKEGPG